MPGTIVDSNVLLDVLTEDPIWYEWSASALEQCANTGDLFINPVIYAEVSIGFDTIEEVESVLNSDILVRLPIPPEAAFLAGKAYMKYKKRSGFRKSPLPDFFIGAHAAVTGMQLLTRDSKRYRTYFPAVHIISPAI